MSGPARTIAEKRADFRALHAAGCFVLPNPWDAGSARYLQGLGFKALATTSSGFAWSRGHADNSLPREAILAHLRVIVQATDRPVNADFESGFGADPAAVGESVGLAVDTGVAGLSVEDSTGDDAAPLMPVEVAVERMRAARRAIDERGGDTAPHAGRLCAERRTGVDAGAGTPGPATPKRASAHATKASCLGACERRAA